MVFASINGIPGVGFAEPSDQDANEHRGKIRLSAANAHRLRRLIEERAALVYYGPVWMEARWQLRSFQLDAADIQPVREDFFMVQFSVGIATSREKLLPSNETAAD
jgi:hypothetical protein